MKWSTKDAGNIRRMFADISPRYDFLNHLLSLNVDRSWRRRAVRELALKPGARVLDVCTGTADLALELAADLSTGKGSRVVAADFTPEMLRLARRKCSQAAGHRVSLCLADTLLLPFAGASFDAVTVAFGLRNVCDLEQGLGEMLRVLKPGGKTAILEFSTPRFSWFRKAFRFYFHSVLPRLGGWVSGSRRGREAYAYLPASVSEFCPPEEFARLLAKAGFADVRHASLSLGIAALYVAERPVRSPLPEPTGAVT